MYFSLSKMPFKVKEIRYSFPMEEHLLTKQHGPDKLTKNVVAALRNRGVIT
jgi:hypothetical protein